MFYQNRATMASLQHTVLVNLLEGTAPHEVIIHRGWKSTDLDRREMSRRVCFLFDVYNVPPEDRAAFDLFVGGTVTGQPVEWKVPVLTDGPYYEDGLLA